MIRPFTTIAAAGALAAATVAVPTQANALAQWVVPTIVVAGVGGLALGVAATAHANSVAVAPTGTVYVQPRAARAAATCQIVRERTRSGAIRRVQICE